MPNQDERWPAQSPFYFQPELPEIAPKEEPEQKTAASPTEEIRDAVYDLDRIAQDIIRLPQSQRAMFASILQDIQDVESSLRRLI